MKYKYYYLILTNVHNTRNPNNKKYALNRYSIILKNNTIPILKIDNKKVSLYRLIRFYIHNYLNLNKDINYIESIKCHNNYIYVSLTKLVDLQDTYKWDNYIDLSERNSTEISFPKYYKHNNNFIHINDIFKKSYKGYSQFNIV